MVITILSKFWYLTLMNELHIFDPFLQKNRIF